MILVPPFIGMSEKFRFGANFLETLEDQLPTLKFLQTLFPGDEISNFQQKANVLTLTYSPTIDILERGVFAYRLDIETELIFEFLEADTLSPFNCEFYVVNNSHFFSFGGKIRGKSIKNRVKLGIFIDELSIRNEFLEEVGIKLLKRVLRKGIRQIFNKLASLSKSIIVS